MLPLIEYKKRSDKGRITQRPIRGHPWPRLLTEALGCVRGWELRMDLKQYHKTSGIKQGI